MEWSYLALLLIISSSTKYGNSLQVLQNSTCTICRCNGTSADCSSLELKAIPAPKKLQTNLTHITYMQNSITHVTKFPLSGIIHLTLSHNHIVRIEEAAFSNLVNITVLDLSYNFLTTGAMLPNVFKGNYEVDSYEPLLNLKVLDLSYNLLHALHHDMFEHTPYIESLSLNGNVLKSISPNTLSALSSLPFLKFSNLSETSLKTIPENLFHALKHLETVDLSGNLFHQPPAALGNSHTIMWLSLSANPIVEIKDFPLLPSLHVLHLNNMPQLVKISRGALINLQSLEEFYCYDNIKLTRIDGTAFSAPPVNDSETETWPPLKVLKMNNNSLSTLDAHLVGRWDKLRLIDLQDNLWTCDCENQWLVSTVVPIIQATSPKFLSYLKCGIPTEMKGIRLLDLYQKNYHMRCLDIYNNRPEQDGLILIGLLISVIISIPLTMIITVYCIRKKRFKTSYQSVSYRSDGNITNFPYAKFST